MADKTYCYPGTDILRNKLNIRDSEKLMEAEMLIASSRLHELQLNLEPGRFDFNHLRRIHKRIFQDLYDWAGQPRTVDIAKGSLFCPAWNIQGYSEDVFRRFYKDCTATKNNSEQFVSKLAAHFADLNALHPFREGNGRTQREFTRELCLECGYVFDLTKTKQEEMLQASRASLDKGDNKGLEDIFAKAVVPIKEYKGLDKKLKSE